MARAGRIWWRRWRRLAIALVAVQAAYVGSYAVYEAPSMKRRKSSPVDSILRID